MKPLHVSPEAAWVAPAQTDRIRDAHTNTPMETAYFLLTFALDSVQDAQAELFISAHSRYKLYVNGTLATYGPCKSDEYHRFGERLDIAPLLRVGENRLLAKVVAFPARESESPGNRGPFWSHNKACGPCLFVQGEVARGGGRLAALTTGAADWRCRVSGEMTPTEDAIAYWLGYKEDVDGAQVLAPDALRAAEGWPPAPVRFYAETTPWGEMPVFPLTERAIPLMTLIPRDFLPTEAMPALRAGVLVPPHSQASFRLDAGELTTGFFRLHTEGGAGAQVDICYAEAYFHDEAGTLVKRRRDDSTGVVHGHVDTYRPTDGAQTYEPFLFRTFRYVELRVRTGALPLRLLAPDYVETGYPLPVHTVLGADNADWVHTLWALSLRTLRRCMHETYEDCPYYEQLQYTMDTRLQMLFTYALGGDARMARQTLHAYHTSRLPNGMLQSRFPSTVPQAIPVFALHWIFMLRDYHQQTGQRDPLRAYLGTVDQVLCYFSARKRADGLVGDLGYWQTVDWAEAWEDNAAVPHACLHGPSTIQNLQYIAALQAAADLVTLFGFSDMAAAYRAEAAALGEALLTACWNPARQLLREGPGFEEYSQHAQLWAVLCGLGTPAQRAALLHALLHDASLIPCSYPTVFYLFRAFEQEGQYEATAPLWDKWRVLLDQGLTTLPEMSFGHPRSDCHAWGSLLLYELPRCLLGVRPAAPGFAEILVQPMGFYIPRAEGSVHVPGGLVHVHRTLEGRTLTVTVTPACPQPVTLRLPDGTQHPLQAHETVTFTVQVP